MTTPVSSKSQVRLATFANVFSNQVGARLARVQEEAEARLKREAAEQERRDRRESMKVVRRERAIAARIPFARSGLKRLLSVGQSEPVQKIFETLGRLGNPNPSFDFYNIQRYDGDAWGAWQDDNFEKASSIGGECNMHLSFYEDGLYFDCSFYYPGERDQVEGWQVLYDPRSEAETVVKGDGVSPSLWSIEDFLSEIAVEKPVNMALVGRSNQRSYEWQPSDVAFQLLVSCARASSFNYYFGRCLKVLEAKVRV